MNRNRVNISRRQFLTRAGAGALALMLPPGMLPAAGRNVAPASAGYPFGFSIVDSIPGNIYGAGRTIFNNTNYGIIEIRRG
jgi:hypothetical protein